MGIHFLYNSKKKTQEVENPKKGHAEHHTERNKCREKIAYTMIEKERKKHIIFRHTNKRGKTDPTQTHSN